MHHLLTASTLSDGQKRPADNTLAKSPRHHCYGHYALAKPPLRTALQLISDARECYSFGSGRGRVDAKFRERFGCRFITSQPRVHSQTELQHTGRAEHLVLEYQSMM
jgi:hypothetical protein